MPAGLVIGGIAQAAGGILSGIAALKQKKEGKGILKKIGEETVPAELLQNQRLARDTAAEGLPAEQYANAMKNIQRNQLAALRGAHDRRGGLATIGQIQQGTNDSTLDLDVADANTKRINQQQFMNVNNQVGNFKNRIWERKYNYGQSLVGAGNQNLYSGIDKFVGGAGLIGYGADGGGGSDAGYNMGGSGMTAQGYGNLVQRSLYNKPRYNPATGRFE